MNAATLGAWRTKQSTSTWDDTIPFLVGGWVLGVLTVVVCSLLDALVMGMIQWLVIGPGNRFWPLEAVIALGIASVILSLLLGVWLFRLRRWVGTKTDPADFHNAQRKRRHFTIGSMCGYVMLTPAIWVLMVGLAFSTAQSPGTIQ